MVCFKSEMLKIATVTGMTLLLQKIIVTNEMSMQEKGRDEVKQKPQLCDFMYENRILDNHFK